MMSLIKKQRLSSVLGLSLDGARLDGVVVRPSGGSYSALKTFSANLALNPLANDAELVGREIRNHLESAGIGERRCVVCVPLEWALVLQTKLPELPEADVASFLAIEAERGFPYAPEALLMGVSRQRTPSGGECATQVAVPRDHIARLDAALKAAKLKPLSYSLGISALQSPDLESSNGVLALAIGESSVGLQVTAGGGVAALRTLEGTAENEARPDSHRAEIVARECRITLGQLPEEVRASVRRFRVFGQSNLARQLSEDLRPRVEAMGLRLETAREYSAADLGAASPASAPVSPAFSLAARHLGGHRAAFEFLPPRVTAWQQAAERYSSGKLVWAGAAAAAVAAVLGALFSYQQYQLSGLREEWKRLEPKYAELDGIQQQIRKYRPWFDDSMRNLSILRRLTEAFPEDGVVTARTIEIREGGNVTCSGTARNQKAFLEMIGRLRATREVVDVKTPTINGSKPLQFTFDFRWAEQGQP